MRTVTCPDCGAEVELPTVHVGDESVVVQCKNCLWLDLDEIYRTHRSRGLAIWGGGLEEMACWTCVPPGNGLQAAINGLGSGGGSLMLQPGTYTGDITVPSTAGNIHVYGAGIDVTYLTGSVLIETSNSVWSDMTIRATGKSYAAKIYKLGAGESRSEFRKVWFGGSTIARTDGPDLGLYLDGAILTVCDHCVFAFCNNDGLFVDTSDPNGTFSTNVNTFRDCTFNGNGRYGVNLTQGAVTNGMMLHQFIGGNIEDNATIDFRAQECTFIKISGMDFETNVSHSSGEIIQITNCQPVLIEDCNFVVGSGATVARMFLFTGVGAGVVTRCRPSGAGTWTQGAIGVFSDGCVQCREYDNILTAAGAGRYINNRGANSGS